MPKKGTIRNLAGQRFGRLTVEALADIKDGRGAYWLCRCQCGETRTIRASALISGRRTGCGCQLRTHGGRYTPEYRAWTAMKQRCTNEKWARFSDYGGRGIRVCALWANNFPAFLAHVGARPSTAHSLDRIENDGNYEPGNVRWATKSEQASNRRQKRAA